MTTINLLSEHPFNTQPHEFVRFLSENKLISLMLMISIMLHAMAFLRFGDFNQQTADKAFSQSLVISLSRITPEAPPEIEQKQQTKTLPKPVQSKPELVKKTERLSKRLITEKTKTPVQDVQEHKQEEQPLSQTAQSQTKTAPVDPALLSRTKDEYMRVLAAHIDKHKFYPRSARRRHIKGQVQVSFDLLTNGQILNLHTFSGHPTLQKATMDSIHSALPMPPRPESLLALNTMKIEYSMQFSLK